MSAFSWYAAHTELVTRTFARESVAALQRVAQDGDTTPVSGDVLTVTTRDTYERRRRRAKAAHDALFQALEEDQNR